MRKRMIGNRGEAVPADASWLDLERVAVAQLSSEDASHPVESALQAGAGPGWRAGEKGQQTIRLVFDEPQRVRRIALTFEENERSRQQEFVLSWSSDGQTLELSQKSTFTGQDSTERTSTSTDKLQLSGDGKVLTVNRHSEGGRGGPQDSTLVFNKN